MNALTTFAYMTLEEKLLTEQTNAIIGVGVGIIAAILLLTLAIIVKGGKK